MNFGGKLTERLVRVFLVFNLKLFFQERKLIVLKNPSSSSFQLMTVLMGTVNSRLSEADKGDRDRS